MMKKIPIRLRLTILSVLLLTLCCIGLTVILNVSANRMADVIEATPITPATEASPGAASTEQKFEAVAMEVMTPSDASQAARNHFFYQSILYAILIIALGGVLTYYLSGKALQPLQELSVQMKNRTVHNLAEDLPVPESNDEIADLTRSFNEMSGKLDETFTMQKHFSQSAAHELRTPLTVLKTKVDVFKKRQDHTAAEYDKLLSVITTHTNRLSDLVKDLLNLTNMDALECNEQFELKTMLTEMAVELSEIASVKNITITVYGEEQFILGNQSLLHRAFYNLLENAIKYNIENGSVDLAITSITEKITITISDTGIGIPIEMRKLIFEPFFRVDKSRSRQMGGAGLGLSTVKVIVDKHHGKIEVSDNLKGGSTFVITLLNGAIEK